MSYDKQIWDEVPGSPNAQVNAARMQHIEDGIQQLSDDIDGIVASLTYENAVPGTRFTIPYNGSAWPSSRPSSRTDIYFDLIGGSTSVADPSWMINFDAREIVV